MDGALPRAPAPAPTPVSPEPLADSEIYAERRSSIVASPAALSVGVVDVVARVSPARASPLRALSMYSRWFSATTAERAAHGRRRLSALVIAGGIVFLLGVLALGVGLIWK